MQSVYYEILGVSSDASLDEIKQAFREKAKAFHPDLNSSPNAHETFIAINEAYTFLLRFREKLAGKSSASDERAEDFYRVWAQQEREKARERAARRAQMKFEEYRKSAIYKTTNKLNHLTDLYAIFIAVFIILASAYGLFHQGLYIVEEGQEILNLKGIVAGIMITMAGISFIILSLSSIKRRQRLNRPFSSP
jgi:hypothetical protein